MTLPALVLFFSDSASWALRIPWQARAKRRGHSRSRLASPLKDVLYLWSLNQSVICCSDKEASPSTQHVFIVAVPRTTKCQDGTAQSDSFVAAQVIPRQLGLVLSLDQNNNNDSKMPHPPCPAAHPGRHLEPATSSSCESQRICLRRPLPQGRIQTQDMGRRA